MSLFFEYLVTVVFFLLPLAFVIFVWYLLTLDYYSLKWLFDRHPVLRRLTDLVLLAIFVAFVVIFVRYGLVLAVICVHDWLFP